MKSFRVIKFKVKDNAIDYLEETLFFGCKDLVFVCLDNEEKVIRNLILFDNIGELCKKYDAHVFNKDCAYDITLSKGVFQLVRKHGNIMDIKPYMVKYLQNNSKVSINSLIKGIKYGY